MIEHWYLVCMILVTSPFNWQHAVTLTLTFDLLQGQSFCRAGTKILRICLFKTKIARAPKQNNYERNTLSLHNNCVQYYDVHFERHSTLTWSVSLWFLYSQTTLPHLFYIQMMTIFTFQNPTFRDWKPAVMNAVWFDLIYRLFYDKFRHSYTYQMFPRVCSEIWLLQKYRIWNEFSFHTVFMKRVVCLISPNFLARGCKTHEFHKYQMKWKLTSDSYYHMIILKNMNISRKMYAFWENAARKLPEVPYLTRRHNAPSFDVTGKEAGVKGAM